MLPNYQMHYNHFKIQQYRLNFFGTFSILLESLSIYERVLFLTYLILYLTDPTRLL